METSKAAAILDVIYQLIVHRGVYLLELQLSDFGNRSLRAASRPRQSHRKTSVRRSTRHEATTEIDNFRSSSGFELGQRSERSAWLRRSLGPI
jgi:hypothetical protein